MNDIPCILNTYSRRDTLDYSRPVIYENGAVKRVMIDGATPPSTLRVCPDGTTSCTTMRGVCAW